SVGCVGRTRVLWRFDGLVRATDSVSHGRRSGKRTKPRDPPVVGGPRGFVSFDSLACAALERRTPRTRPAGKAEDQLKSKVRRNSTHSQGSVASAHFTH